MRKQLLIGSMTVLAALTGCYNEPDNLRLFDDLVVATNFDPDADFTSYATYAMATDTIGLVSNRTNDTIITQQESAYPRLVLNKLRDHLNSRGYNRVERTADPDLAINVVVVNDFNVFQQVIYPDPYGYPGSYYYGYGSYYYYPYPVVNTYSSNNGVLIIEMIDLRNKTLDNKVRVIWDAYMGDVYSTADIGPATERAIDQAFLQSPYVSR